MYANYFGFRDIPFRQLSDPRHVYMSSEFETARAELLEAVQDDARLVLLTGHAGTGKTKLLRHLHAYLEPQRAIFYLPFSPLQIETFIAQTACELDIELGAEPNTDLFEVFQQGLRAASEHNGRPVLLIDDAHNLGCDVLENLIDLFQLAPGQEPLAVLVLAAHPEIEYTLQRPELKELEENLARLSRLQPLAVEDVGPYIMFALRSIGYEGEPVFTKEAIRRVAAQSRGIPRLINTVCEAAFLVAYGQDQNPITPDIVDAAAEEIAGFTLEDTHEVDIDAAEEEAEVEWVIEEIEPTKRPSRIPEFLDGWLKRSRNWPVAAVGVGGSVAVAAIAVLLFTVPFDSEEDRLRDEHTAMLERMETLRGEVSAAHAQRDDLQAELDYQVEQRDLLAMQLEQLRSRTAQEQIEIPVSEPVVNDEVVITIDANEDDVSTTAEALLEELMKNAEAEADSVASEFAEDTTATVKAPVFDEPGVHTVRAGDTLWNISQRYGLSVDALQAINGLGDGGNIIVGQKLTVTENAVAEISKLNDPVAVEIESNRGDSAWYTVKAGDSLYGIGRQFQSSVDDLKKWNQLADAKLLVGQKLRVAQ